MKNLIVLILFPIAIFSQISVTELVDPFIGTGAHGHTYPGATVPFGMVQLSPDTDTKGWDWCSGYHESDNSIIGFSHTHLSGTGGADLGDILLMPISGKVNFDPGSKDNPESGYRSSYSHEYEKATPGFYSVHLDDYNIDVQLTATTRTGFHKYAFLNKDSVSLMIDLKHGISDIPKEGYFKMITDKKIAGYRESAGWAKSHRVYFVMEFDKPISGMTASKSGELVSDFNDVKDKELKVALGFGENIKELLVKVSLSYVSIEGAENNLNAENPNWDFELIKNSASKSWNKELSKIIVEGGTLEDRRVFYTSLYHTMIVPNLFQDVDGKYMGMDGNVYTSNDHTHYSLFSLWDTFRATHPLYSIIDKERTNDFIKSLHYKGVHQGFLPFWELVGTETWCMIGYHSIPVIVDAYLKGIRDYDVEAVYSQMVNSAMLDHQGLKYYKKMHFIPMDKEDDAASRTLEYAYDDWCIAQMAKALGKNDDYKLFMERALYYRNLFDKKTRFIRGRFADGRWKPEFYPEEPFPLGPGEFTEGSSWQYTWFVPQDIDGLISLMGSDDRFISKLDSLFIASSNPKFMMPSDVTGLIGQYAHGNEPSHHVSYLYTYAGKPEKTQEKVRQIMKEMYTDKREGLCGNEDCGQMSAWFVFSSMGFYPVVPGSNEYVIGSPIFDKVTINLENGKKFVVISKNNSDKNIYVSSVQLNGSDYSKTYFKETDFANGGELILNMSNTPGGKIGISKIDRPHSGIDNDFIPSESTFLFPPYPSYKGHLFNNKLNIELGCFSSGSKIFYTLDGSKPDTNSTLYSEPLEITQSVGLKAVAFKKGFGYSDLFEQDYSKAIIFNETEPYYSQDGLIYPQVKILSSYDDKYSGGGDSGLIDGLNGTTNFLDGRWQGYYGEDLNVIIDLGKPVELKRIVLSSLKTYGSWIFSPENVVCYTSLDDKDYSLCDSVSIGNKQSEDNKEIIKTPLQANKAARYVKVIAKNNGICPEWHYAAGNKAYIFIDEITLEE